MTSTSSTTRMLGAWGGIAALALGLFGAYVPGAAVLSTVALIVVLVAFLRAAAEVRRPRVRRATLISLALTVAAVGVVLAFASDLFSPLLSGGGTDALGNVDFSERLISVLLLAWLLLVASAWFAYVASAELSKATGVGLFRISGLIYFIGVATTLVFVGLLLVPVAAVLQVIAFFSVPQESGAQA